MLVLILVENLFCEDVAEERDLVADRILNRLFAPANDNVGRYAEAAKFPNTCLKWKKNWIKKLIKS